MTSSMLSVNDLPHEPIDSRSGAGRCVACDHGIAVHTHIIRIAARFIISAVPSQSVVSPNTVK